MRWWLEQNQACPLTIFDSHGDAFFASPNEDSGFYISPGGTITESLAGISKKVTLAILSNNVYPDQLAVDASGNLYGDLTKDAGASGYDPLSFSSLASLFKITAGTDDLTTLATLPQTEFANAHITSMVCDKADNLIFAVPNGSTGGVYELRSGASSIVQLASFNSAPAGVLTVDPSGNVLGVVPAGGPDKKGEIFKIAAGTETVRTLAVYNGSNGSNPLGVIADTAGNVYGVTSGGGAFDDGTAFKISTATSSLSTIVNFNPDIGTDPAVGLFADARGNLYGTTSTNGPLGSGTLFKIIGSGFVASG
jgi:uncharacterized repeat protein (TIGR03803 family)